MDNGLFNRLATPYFFDGSDGVKRNTAFCHKSKKQNHKVRRRRLIRKGMSELVYGEKDRDACNSELPISDEDIEHKNSMILKEVEATWKVSSVLGITFDRDKNQVIEVFKEFEENDRRVRMGRE